MDQLLLFMGQKQGPASFGDNMVRSTQMATTRGPGMEFSGNPVMQRNTSFIGTDKSKRSMGYFDSFLALFGGHRLFNLHPDKERVEVKVLMQALAATGITSYIMGIVLNLDNWRSMVLLMLGAAFMVIRICVYTAKSIHDHKVRKWEFEQRKKEANK